MTISLFVFVEDGGSYGPYEGRIDRIASAGSAHLASKIDPAKLGYRPTPKQRSILELLQYMAIMGPTQIAVIKAGAFNRAALSAAWGPAEAAASGMTFDQASPSSEDNVRITPVS